MPVALERKLRREANKKDIKDKDAYVYGTLRKTGWKPNREKKMKSNSKLVRLSAINAALDPIVKFNDNRRSLIGDTALAGGAVAAGVGGTLGHQAIVRSGGYGQNWQNLKTGFNMERSGLGAGVTPGSSSAYKIGSTLGNPKRALLNTPEALGKGVSSGLGKIFNPSMLAKIKGFFMQSNTNPITFDENILEPFGATPASKISQEQFPAGKSPGYQRDPTAEILNLPLPEIMRLLKERNILQQQYPGFSAKAMRLMELSEATDRLINFAGYYDDEERSNWGNSLIGPAAGLGAGVGAVVGHRMIMNRGGYGAAWNRLTGGSAPQAGPGIAGLAGAAPKAVNPAVAAPAAVAASMGRPVAAAARPAAAAAAASRVITPKPQALGSTMERIGSRWAKAGFFNNLRKLPTAGMAASAARFLTSEQKLVRLSQISSQMDEILFAFKPPKKGDKDKDMKGEKNGKKNMKKPFKPGHRSHAGGT